MAYLFDAYPPRGTLSALTAAASFRVVMAGLIPLVIIQSTFLSSLYLKDTKLSSVHGIDWSLGFGYFWFHLRRIPTNSNSFVHDRWTFENEEQI